MDINDIHKLLGGGGRKKKFATVAKISPEEVVRFLDLEVRTKTLASYIQNIQSKINADKDRLWADIKDKYKLHKYPQIHYKESTGEIRAPSEHVDKKKREGEDDK